MSVRYCFFICLISIILPGLLNHAAAEHIFRKDGSIVEGKIIADRADGFVLQKNDKKIETIRRAEILRVLYTDLYMGKVFIRLTDGRVLEGYKVDEDQKTYTFRKELNRNEEFTMERNKVLFIAISNPTDLEGIAGTKEIELKWNAPFKRPERYKVYCRTGKELDPRPIAETEETRYVMRDLKSNTRYQVHVTAVEKSGSESLPSNQLDLLTKNVPPRAPEDLRVQGRMVPAGNKLTATIAWKNAEDVDGTIKEYRVSLREGRGKFEPAGTSAATEFKLKGLKDRTDYEVKIAAVDDRGDISPMSDELEFNTANRLPEAPRGLSIEKQIGSSAKVLDAKLSWNPARDTDGDVTAYHVYRDTAKGFTLVSTTEKLNYTATDLDVKSRHIFVVRAVDDRGGESGDSDSIIMRGDSTWDSYARYLRPVLPMKITAAAAYITPLGDAFSTMFGSGWGAQLTFSTQDVIIKHLNAGFQTGYSSLPGNHFRVESLQAIPALLVASYSLPVFDVLSVAPVICGGVVYNRVAYVMYDPDTVGVLIPRTEAEGALEPLFKAGFEVNATLAGSIVIEGGAAYGFHLESGERMDFMSVYAGAGMRLGM